MKEIKITYDGKVYVSKHSFALGEFAVSNLVHSSLGFAEEECQDINAEVTILVKRKPDVPFIETIEGDKK